MLLLILITVILTGLAVIGIAIKMFLKKDGQFTKTCSSIELKSGEKIACSCGGKSEDVCENRFKHHPEKYH